VTLGEYLLDRLGKWAAAKKIGNKTAERYGELAKHQIISLIGDKRLQKLKAIDIENWHSDLIAKGLSTRTIGNAHTLLSRCFKEAARLGLVVKNVVAESDKPKSDTKEVEIIDADRLPQLLSKLSGHRLYTRAIISLFCGLRRGELLALRWSHVKLDRKTIEVREALEETIAHGIVSKPPKTKAGNRDVTMPDIVIEALRSHLKSERELRMRLGLGNYPPTICCFTPSTASQCHQDGYRVASGRCS
jgi:integrase